MPTELRPLGRSGLQISSVAMGCWPIAGITTLNVTRNEALDTLRAAFESGIRHFDTAYMYGYEGESEQMLGEALGDVRDQITIATKGGVHWENRQQAHDARPETLRRELQTSLERLGVDSVELYYLHFPDPNTPLNESAAAIRGFREEGLIRATGLSNATVEQLTEFDRHCPLDACQPPYNMLQRGIEQDVIPWCQQHDVSVVCYWPLMKGLLAGHLGRDHQFAPEDKRRKYPIFSADQWDANQDFLDVLRDIAGQLNRTVSQVVLNWTIHRPGITAGLAGARRPDQIRDNAAAMGWRLGREHLERIEQAMAARGPIRS